MKRAALLTLVLLAGCVSKSTRQAEAVLRQPITPSPIVSHREAVEQSKTNPLIKAARSDQDAEDILANGAANLKILTQPANE